MENREELIGYKICLFDLDFLALFSATFNRDTLYKFGAWVSRKPLCGPLAIFGSIEDAKKWIRRIGSPSYLKIVKCKYIKSKEKYLYHKKYRLRLSIDSAPEGTILADEVMLLEEIKRY